MSSGVEIKRTVHLPSTSFSMKANLPEREPRTLEWWDRIDAYRRIREARADARPFVLHDGPPYANGNIHLGHALNKILKDFVVKAKTMAGFDARFVPGWDCHGLPIENRIDKELGRKKAELGALGVRQRCREFAERSIAIQSDEFRRLGVLWDRSLDTEERAAGAPNRRAIYRTLDRTYESQIVRHLGGFFQSGSIYHGVKPVHWCPHCRTALAEAEVEYEDRTDPSIYVRFPVHGAGKRIPALLDRRVAILVWTTTPWTLPANLAVALHPTHAYVAVDVDGEAWILAADRVAAVGSVLGWTEPPRIVARFRGAELVGEGPEWVGRTIRVERPYPTRSGSGAGDGVLILGDHVTLESGTGCVHTAPGHGVDDFRVGRAYELEPFNPVDDGGKFDAAKLDIDWLVGMPVLEANPRIVDDLAARGLLLAHEDYRHSYPHCWRCAGPILFRATPQWFIAMDAVDLRRRAIEAIQEVHWHPASGRARIEKMVEGRPDWCISRQRTWGVPIPAVVCAVCIETDEHAFIRDPRFFAHLESLFLAEGSDAWFGVPGPTGEHRPYSDAAERLARLVPAGVTCPSCDRGDRLNVHDHIVDVWFESGVSHAAVLGHEEGLPWPADLYLEGHDQYRGWFQSSLLVGVHSRGRAPYRAVVTHGFTLDGEGRKMSKSHGNVISPQDVASRSGGDILRLWVAMVDFLDDMRLSQEILERNAEAYRKIRNTFRYLLGNLHGFDPRRDLLAYDDLEEIDRWALQLFEQLRGRSIEAYEQHQYHAIHQGLHQFCAVTLSAFYLDVLKDRLYTAPLAAVERRSAQTVLWRLADGLCRLMAPLVPFTAEEIWQEIEVLRGNAAWGMATIHAERFPDPLEVAPDPALVERWTRLVAVRNEINRTLETARRDGRIGSSLEADVAILAEPELLGFLGSFGDALRFYLLTSGVRLGGEPDPQAVPSEAIPGLSVAVLRASGTKCERCWHFTTDVGQHADWPTICNRCVTSVRYGGGGPAT